MTARRRWYKFFYFLVFVGMHLVYPMRFTGRENIPEDGALVCANHSSATDPLFVAIALGRNRQIRAMAKESLFQIPVLGWILKKVGTFSVKRGAADIHAIKFAMDELKDHQYVVVFPEGTRIASREEGNPKTGAAMLACRTGANVLPIYIPFKKKPFRMNRIYIGKAYTMQPEKKKVTAAEYQAFTDELMDRIYDCGDRA